MSLHTHRPPRRSPLGVVLATTLIAGTCAVLLAAAPAHARDALVPGVSTSVTTYYTDESTGTYDTNAHSDAFAIEGQSSASTHGENAWAFASLSGGLMRISGSAAPVTPEHPEEPFHRTSSGAQAIAAIYDNLVIEAGDVIPAGGIGAFMPWSVTIDGSLSGFNGVSFGYFFGDDDWKFTSFEGGTLTIEGEFVLHPGQNVVPFGMTIQGGTGYNSESAYAQGGSFDLSHTVRVHFDAPPGLQVTTTSGVFPIGPTAPVPEPGTAWLAGAGLLWGMARRRARA